MNMFSSFFPNKENDLDGRTFKQRFENSNNGVLVDVRTAPEFNNDTIPGAINMDFMSPGFQKEVEKLNKEKTYFVFCRSGGRSSAAASLLRKIGLTSFNLIGGIGAWPN